MKKCNLKPEYFLLAILIIGLILIVVSFFKQLNFADNSKQIQKGKKIELLVGDMLEQKFITMQNGLNNLKILFSNKNLQEGYFMKFILADENCKKEIYTGTLKGEYEFGSKYLYDFNFPKIKDSKDKKYCLKIVLKEERWGLWRKVKVKVVSKFGRQEEQKKQKIRLFEQINSNDNTEKYVIMGKLGKIRSEGLNGISFRQSYKNPTIAQDFQQLNQRMSQYKPWFLKGWCLVTIVVFIITLMFLSVTNVFKR